MREVSRRYRNMDETKSNDRFVDSDEKFRRFLISNLFNNGVHAWWIICLFAVIAMVGIVFSFIAAYVDMNLALSLQKSPKDQKYTNAVELSTSDDILLEI